MGSPTPSSLKSSERMHYLDALRAFVMSIGVVLHASLTAGVHHWAPQAVTTFSHLFRMKLFIIIGGYFFALQAAKIGSRAVTKDRIRRLGVPIMVFLLIFNPITIYIWNAREDQYPEVYYYAFNMPGEYLNTHGAGWHLHIWFLVVLLVYCVVLSGFTLLIKISPFNNVVAFLEKMPNWLILIILAVTTSGLFAVGRALHFLLFQNLTKEGPFNYIVQATLTYAPFFALGIVFYNSKKVFSAMHSVSIFQTIVSWIFLAAVWSNGRSISTTIGFAPSEAVRHFAQEFAGFYICCIMFFVFSRYVIKQNKAVRYLSDSSYTVYLFHIFVLVCVDWLLFSFTGNRFIVYIVSIPMAYAVCLALHQYIVMPSPMLSLLFNGRFLRTP